MHEGGPTLVEIGQYFILVGAHSHVSTRMNASETPNITSSFRLIFSIIDKKVPDLVQGESSSYKCYALLISRSPILFIG